jgi:hypothetical protein
MYFKRLAALKKFAALGLLVALIVVAGAGDALAQSTDLRVDIRDLPRLQANEKTIQSLLNIIFGVIGAVSILMIAVGGFRYIASQGDSQAAAKAKGTVQNALIGLIVAITAIAIVTFIVGNL